MVVLAACVALAGCIPVASATRTPVDAADAAVPASSIHLRLIGARRIESGHEFGGTRVGGISGIDYDPSRDLYYLISDDRAVHGPTRFYTARLVFDAAAFRDVALQSVVTLLQPDGAPYPTRARGAAADAEAIRFDAATRTLWWTSEGERRTDAPTRLVDPFVRQSTLDGRHVGEVPLDPMFRMRPDARGPRHNRVFEGLALAPDGASLWVAMEGPLLQDGPMPTTASGAWVRLSRHPRTPAQTFGPIAAQFAYRLDPLPASARWGLPGAVNGVSELLALDASRLLVLERALVLDPMTWHVRLYEAETRGATDVRTIDALDGAFVPAAKRLVLDFDTLGIAIDNLEGLCFGPRLANGHGTLVLVADDNFNPGEATQFLVFEIVSGP